MGVDVDSDGDGTRPSSPGDQQPANNPQQPPQIALQQAQHGGQQPGQKHRRDFFKRAGAQQNQPQQPGGPQYHNPMMGQQFHGGQQQQFFQQYQGQHFQDDHFIAGGQQQFPHQYQQHFQDDHFVAFGQQQFPYPYQQQFPYPIACGVQQPSGIRFFPPASIYPSRLLQTSFSPELVQSLSIPGYPPGHPGNNAFLLQLGIDPRAFANDGEDPAQQLDPYPPGHQQSFTMQNQGGQAPFMPGPQQASNTAQQLSSVAPPFQPGAQQHFTAQGTYMQQQHVTSGQQGSNDDGQQLSPDAPQFQPGVQQHFTAGGQPIPNGPAQPFPQVQQGQDAPPHPPGWQQHFTTGGQPISNEPVQTFFRVPQGQDAPHFSNGGGDHEQAFFHQLQGLPLPPPALPLPPQGPQQYPGPQQMGNGQQPSQCQWSGGDPPRTPRPRHRMPQFDGADEYSDDDAGNGNEDAMDEDSDEYEDEMDEDADEDEDEMDGSDGGDNDYEDEDEYDVRAHNQNEEDGDGGIEIPEDLLNDPLYHKTMKTLDDFSKQAQVPLTEAAKANFAAFTTRRQQQKAKNKRLADEGDVDFEADLLEEAARAGKRRRVGQEDPQFYEDPQKVYLFGPPNRPEPEPMDEDSDEDSDEGELSGPALDAHILGLPAEFKGQYSGEILSMVKKEPEPEHKIFEPGFRLMESICSSWWFMIEITKHMSVKDLIKLYSISRTFHARVNERFQSTILAWAQHKSPAGVKVYLWKTYGKYTIKDPAGKTWAKDYSLTDIIPRPPWAGPRKPIPMQNQIRRVPGFRYLDMLAERETRTRDILACLARAGHRLPKTMHVTLKKIWMLMDMATNALRRAWIHNRELWTDQDLYNAQMFWIKLQMRFNEPIFGPKSRTLAQTFLGSRKGLTPLWKLLRRKAYTNPEEVIQQRLRYYVRESFTQHYLLIGEAFFGVNPTELGEEHKEGWGAGNLHMLRPDELVIEECVRRRIDGVIKKHLVFMVFWGHVDWKGRRNLVPTEEEMYMSDDELPPLPDKGKYSSSGLYGRCGNVPFEYGNWQPKHAMKARWKTLTRDEKLAIVKDDEDEQLRAMEFEKGDNSFWMPFNINNTPPPEKKGPEKGHRRYPTPDALKLPPNAGVDDPWFHSVMPDPYDDTRFEVTLPLWPELEEKKDEEPAREEVEETYEDDKPLEIPDSVEDPDIIAKWDDMDPYLQQMIIDEEDRLAKQDDKDERTLAMVVKEDQEREKKKLYQEWWFQGAPTPSGSGTQQQDNSAGPSSAGPVTYRYEYPSITDPLLLSLLRKYDRFAPDEFRIDEDGSLLPPPTAPPAAVEAAPKPKLKPKAERTAADPDTDPEDMDDEHLKALADYDYDSEELEQFDYDKYKKFLDRVGDNGGCIRPTGGDKDEGKKKDLKGKGKAVAVADDSDEEMMDEMVHEADVEDDGDIPFPEYEFRKF